MTTPRIQSINVTHNVEMGHRLSQYPDSKCFHLHGHSWWVTLHLIGEVNEDGMIVDFATVKREWRKYLDTHFDHHMCLSEEDPFVRMLLLGPDRLPNGARICEDWGITIVPFDPTVENMAMWWGKKAQQLFGPAYRYDIEVKEASTNGAGWSSG
jgi:6-pyruvoyl-tetrahydropterin synthase